MPVLGNNYTKAFWEANTLNAYDVIYSAVAAKKVWPTLLSDEWVAIGHSQGNLTHLSGSKSEQKLIIFCA